MHTPNPRLGRACIAAVIKDEVMPYQAIDGSGEVLDVVRPSLARDGSMIEGLSFDEITARIDPNANDTPYAPGFVDRVYTPCRWRQLAETTQR